MKKILLLAALLAILQACSNDNASKKNPSLGPNDNPTAETPTNNPGSNPTAPPADNPRTAWKEEAIDPKITQNTPPAYDPAEMLAAANSAVLVVYDNQSTLYESADAGITWQETFRFSAQPSNIVLNLGKVRVRSIEGKIYADMTRGTDQFIYRRIAKNNWVEDSSIKAIFNSQAQSAKEQDSGALKGEFYYTGADSFPYYAKDTQLTDNKNVTPNLINRSFPYFPMNLARDKVFLLGQYQLQQKVGIISGKATDFRFLIEPFPEVLNQQAVAMASSPRYDLVVTTPTGKLNSPSFYRAPYSDFMVRDATHWALMDLLKKYSTPSFSFVDLKYLAERFVLVLNQDNAGKSSCVVNTSTFTTSFAETVLNDAVCRSVHYIQGKYVLIATKTAGPNAGKLFFVTASAL